MNDEKGLQNEMDKFRNGVRTTLKQLYFFKFLYTRWYVMYMSF